MDLTSFKENLITFSDQELEAQKKECEDKIARFILDEITTSKLALILEEQEKRKAQL